MNVNLTPNITGKNVNIIKGATQADLTNSVNNSKIYRDEAEAFSIVSEDKSIEASYSALNASISSTTASDKATIATTKANEANNSAINASASEAVCIAKATISTDNANIAIAQAVIATNKASEASTDADTATTQAGIAITKASEASVSASSALASKNAASSSAISALASANSAADSEANSIASSTSAEGSAIMATTKANEASSSAYNANNSAIDALSSKNSAIASASSATLKASEASSSATVSANKASEASTSASNALVSANNAYTSEANALTYRNEAESFANSINHSDLVHISGTETITGNKTFSGTVSGLTKATVGLGNIDNTSDANKPVSTAMQNALNTKVDTTTNQTIAGVKTFSSSPIVPTPTTGTQAANKAYVDSVAVNLDASTTVKGIVELATNEETATGTDTVRAITPAGLMSAFNKTGTAPMFACRAWVNFNGTGTVAIRESGNVSSITDNGAGQYTVNFTTAMADTNYSVQAIHDAFGPGQPFGTVARNKTISSIYIGTVYNNAYNDVGDANVSIIR